MLPSGGTIESAAITRTSEETATSTPVRHQTRTAPLIRGRDDFRCASTTWPLSSNATIRLQRRSAESVLRLVSGGAAQEDLRLVPPYARLGHPATTNGR